MQFILTGDAARQAAMEHAELMAIVSTDRLNARTEPSTDAKIWTQISNNERYHVAEQLDGWVKIEFDEGGEGDGPMRYLRPTFPPIMWMCGMPWQRPLNSLRQRRAPPSEARS